MCTGHHAAVSAGVRSGSVVAAVGDGAVGLCAVIAAHRLGAERIIALSRNPKRQELARSFGATDILAERGDAAIEAIREMTDGVGVDAALQCVGTGRRWQRRWRSCDTGRSWAPSGRPMGSTSR
jgi:threonine dehydrogenase-like Zn-dependent dehydrogenase